MPTNKTMKAILLSNTELLYVIEEGDQSSDVWPIHSARKDAQERMVHIIYLFNPFNKMYKIIKNSIGKSTDWTELDMPMRMKFTKALLAN